MDFALRSWSGGGVTASELGILASLRAVVRVVGHDAFLQLLRSRWHTRIEEHKFGAGRAVPEVAQAKIRDGGGSDQLGA